MIEQLPAVAGLLPLFLYSHKAGGVGIMYACSMQDEFEHDFCWMPRPRLIETEKFVGW